MLKYLQSMKQYLLKNYRLNDCEIYITLEPCHMCAKAIVDARISHLYFGALEPKTGAIKSIDQFLDRNDLNHRVSYSGGYMEKQSSDLLKSFFKSKRKNFLKPILILPILDSDQRVYPLI